MKKERITYDSSVDALVSVSKRLSLYEKKYNLISENFHYKYTKGELTVDNEITRFTNESTRVETTNE